MIYITNFFLFFFCFCFICCHGKKEITKENRDKVSCVQDSTFDSLIVKKHKWVDSTLYKPDDFDTLIFVFENRINDSLIICNGENILYKKRLYYNKSVGRVPFDIKITSNNLKDDFLDFYFVDSREFARVKIEEGHKYYYAVKLEKLLYIEFSEYMKVYR